MACKCVNELDKKYRKMILDGMKERGTRVSGEIKTGFQNRVMVFNKGDFSPLCGNFFTKYRKKKVNGDPAKNMTSEESTVRFTHCPFCGTKFNGAEAS